MIPKERATVIEKYRQSGKEIVEFKPPLFLEEWEELMKYQEQVTGFNKGEGSEDGKEKTEPEKPKTRKKV